MRNPLRRRWMLERYDRRTGEVVTPEPPEPRVRRYWTYSGALADEVRLNSALTTYHSHERFRIRYLGLVMNDELD